MKLLTKAIHDKLLANGRLRQERIDDTEIDFYPVVKLFTPDGACTWLLTELEAEDPDIAFGLCDLGLDTPELGTVRLSELQQLRGRLGLPVERDRHFRADKPLQAYAEAAWDAGRIIA